MDDGAGNGNALTFAAGEQVGPGMGAGGKTDSIERFGYTLAAFTGAYTLD
jgi:hypothetical protein